MPNTKLQLIAMSILAAGMFVAAQGCSSSSSGGNLMAACMQGCTKEVPCLADAGFSETVSACVQTCLASGQPDGGTCTNESAIVSAAQACGANGAAGNGGGTGGAGGAAADCSVCTKAAACCTAANEPAALCSAIPTAT